MTEEEVAKTNFKVLIDDVDSHQPLDFFMPSEQPLELMFFRLMFIKLRDSLRPDEQAQEGDEVIPVEVFQRAFERLLFVLRDPEDNDEFDAQMYDENGNGFVGWGEFCYVYAKKKPCIKYTVLERIFLTFERQESSGLAKIVSTGMLSVIILSSLMFVLSTVEECQDESVDGQPPTPKSFFNVIEWGCMTVFVIDYVARLCTSWAVRPEVLDRGALLELSVGYNQIHLQTVLERLLNFVFKRANLIDLIAIVPSLIEMIQDPSGKGGSGFVVLRLIRLTRILRVFKDPSVQEPIIVIERTIKLSTRALYVLGFNLTLGIVIFGSLMWVVEGGTWNAETQTYQRDAWNGDTHNFTLEDTPYVSIPHSFWWAIVTATTAGYGDFYPRSSFGYMVAVLCMSFSMVILALPVGVIGGTFSSVWEEYEIERSKWDEEMLQERKKITLAVETINPAKMRSLMLIEVWNERFFCKDNIRGQAWTEGEQERPQPAEFLGHAMLELDLPMADSTETKILTLLDAPEIVDRKVSGHIVLQYHWQWEGRSPASQAQDDLDFQGRLTVSLLTGHHLLNLNIHSLSNPFCLLYCYPLSPDLCGGRMRPATWRSPTACKTLNPEWYATHEFAFRWHDELDDEEDSPHAAIAPAPMPPDAQMDAKASVDADEQRAEDEESETMQKLTQAVDLLQTIRLSLDQASKDVQGLGERVERLPTCAGPKAWTRPATTCRASGTASR